MAACACEEKETKSSLFGKEFWVKIVRLIIALTLALVGYFYLTEAAFGVWSNFAIMAVAWLVVGYDIVYEAFSHVFKGHNPFDEDMLMTIASLGAFCLRFFGPENNDFFEAVLVVFLFQVGELFEDIATARSHAAITSAVGLRAPSANLLKNGEVLSVKPETLALDDLILVKVGEIVPADGIITEGEGSLDMSSLTGESYPVKKKVGEEVPSGTILRCGSLTIRVNKEYENSTVSKILRLVEEGAKSKSSADRFIDKFSRIYTPVVVALAVLLAILPPLFLGISDSATWQQWVYRALSFLVISCPCAIVISVPLSYFAGIGLASKHGLIIKGAAFFDQLNNLGLVVTDKTGTLTYGTFQITKKEVVGLSEEDFMRYLRAGESRSNHPLASAIIGDKEVASLAAQVTSYDEVAGLGTKAVYEGHEILVGSGKLLSQNGVSFAPSNEVGTIVYLAVDKTYAGYVVLSDTIRKESLDMVEGLHHYGIKVAMLTGDQEKNALAVSQTLGLDGYRSGLLPEEKTALLKSYLKPQGKAVAYVGDGINDAPSIIASDIGVAMGGVGSDLAIQNADVVIMNDDPSKLVLAYKIAKATRARALSDIILALLVKLTIMLLAIFLPGFPLLVAVLADTGLTMVLVLFSLLLLYKRV
jgi:Cd2+/Zn2+-exporting ATPase